MFAIPIAAATRVIEPSRFDEYGSYTVEVVCPYCVYRKRPYIHTHGFEPDMINSLSHRVAHCSDSNLPSGVDNSAGYNIFTLPHTPMYSSAHFGRPKLIGIARNAKKIGSAA